MYGREEVPEFLRKSISAYFFTAEAVRKESVPWGLDVSASSALGRILTSTCMGSKGCQNVGPSVKQKLGW